jgi:hypothetical protein
MSSVWLDVAKEGKTGKRKQKAAITTLATPLDET